jgi:hypothetical protein
MKLKFDHNTALTVKCISAVACALGFTKVSIALKNAQLAIANSLVLLAIISMLFGQCLAPKSNDVTSGCCKAPPRCFGHPTYYH